VSRFLRLLEGPALENQTLPYSPPRAIVLKSRRFSAGGTFSLSKKTKRNQATIMPSHQISREHTPGTKSIPVLLVDDDVGLCDSLKRLLAMDGFDVKAVHDGDSGVRHALKGEYELVILDVMLPGGDGRKVLRRIRLTSQVPVIMLTARGDEAARIAGLERGADDYLPKPFNPRELVARMRAVLRRKNGAAVPEILRIGDLQMDCVTRGVAVNGSDVALTGAEFDILLLLVRSAGKVLSREEIAEAALGRPIGFFDRSIDNHISNLRKKLGARVRKIERIRNVRGAGYVYAGEIIEDRR
jgi:two-component system, OmpR family, response regulator CpxR